MNDWIKQVKESWNEIADSEWYQSLRTDEIIAKLVEKPLLNKLRLDTAKIEKPLD